MIAVHVADYRRFMSGFSERSIDLILTDPPYGISQRDGYRHSNGFKVNVDFGSWDEDMDFETLVSTLARPLKAGGTLIIWCDLWKLSYLADSMRGAGLEKLRPIIWEKSNPTPINQRVGYLTRCREMAVMGVKKGKATFNDKYHSGFFKYPIVHPAHRYHATQKPLGLFSELVRIHSNEGDLVVDPFLGSGTTALAAVSQQRAFSGCDISQEYIGISLDRLMFFGEK